MWSNLSVGMVFGLGFGAWVYSKMYRSTGGNTKNALIVAAVAGIISMLLVVMLLGIFFKA